MVDVYISRHSPGLKPGDGEKIGFEIGETVDVIAGQDKGKEFVVTSGRMSHPQADGFVREGYFADDLSRRMWCKAEKVLWFK